jgi:hypothetical protein
MQLWQRRVFGILALGGSFLGVSLVIEQLLAPVGLSDKALILPFLVLYACGIWCGLELIEGAAGALRSNRIFWMFQIPFITSPIFSYAFASGAVLNISFQPAHENLNFFVRLGSQLGVSLFRADVPWAFGVNVFALGACLYLTLGIRREGEDSREHLDVISGASA